MISALQSKLTAKTTGRSVFHFSELSSTSTYIKNMWQYLPHGHVVIADEQLAGRGRSGKSFYSPKADGLYFSVLLTEQRYVTDPLLTVKASIALCKAIDLVTDTKDVRIKWVNDIYINKKKLSGILCEALKWNDKRGVILGIGVNITLNKGEIPSELKGKIGCLRDVAKKSYDRAELCALILEEFERLYENDTDTQELLDFYRSRSCVLGKEIQVLKNGSSLRAAALDITKDGGLAVRYEDGITETLTAGEISIDAFSDKAKAK